MNNDKMPMKKIIIFSVVIIFLAMITGYLIKNTSIFQGASNCTVNCPPIISNSLATNITGTTATFTWNTDLPSDSSVQYGPYLNITTPVNTALVTSHSVSVTGLSPNTTYQYKVISKTSSGQSASSQSKVFTTTSTSVPIISSIIVSGISQTGVNMSWNTDIPANSQVEYGTTTSYGSTTTLDPAQVTSHSASISGLNANTLYHFRVLSGTAQGGDQTFTTLPPVVDTTKPTVSVVSPTSNSVLSGTVNISANASDNVGVTKVDFYSGTTLIGTDQTNPYSIDWNTIGTPNSQVIIKAKAFDATGNMSTSAGKTVTVLNSDPGPLPVITDISATNIGQSSVVIIWNTDIISTTQVEYGITTSYGSSTNLNSNNVTSHSSTISNLNSGTTYHYRVKSSNATGTKVSSDKTFTTLAGTALVISNVASSNVTTSGAVITWSTNDISNSQVEYGTTTSYGSTTTLDPTLTMSHSVTLSGLNSNTAYHYRVKSGSVVSPDNTFTTGSTVITLGNFLIQQGAHYFSGNPAIASTYSDIKMVFNFRFNASSNYVLQTSTDQGDINKLAGGTDCGNQWYQQPDYSARFGWRCFDGAHCTGTNNGIQIFGYVHYKAAGSSSFDIYSKYIGDPGTSNGSKISVPIGAVATGQITTVANIPASENVKLKNETTVYTGSGYRFDLSYIDPTSSATISYDPVYLPRFCTGVMNGYKNYPYFGGTSTAPHDINIELGGALTPSGGGSDVPFY
jgi:phosphodiesterase/alkaline phosphatase D-like protein